MGSELKLFFLDRFVIYFVCKLQVIRGDDILSMTGGLNSGIHTHIIRDTTTIRFMVIEVVVILIIFLMAEAEHIFDTALMSKSKSIYNNSNVLLDAKDNGILALSTVV